jgi:hypothetical protein
MKRLIKLAKALSSLGLPHSYSILKLAGIEIDKDDLNDAIEHANQIMDDNLSDNLSGWEVDSVRWMLPEEVAGYEDGSGWIDFSLGELKDLTKEELYSALKSFRSTWTPDIIDALFNWEEKKILKPIIIFELNEREGYPQFILGDGRGRVNLATGLDIEVPVVFLREKKSEEESKKELLYAILKGEELSDSESQVLQPDSLKKFLVEMGGEIKEFPIEGHGNYFLVKLDSKSYVFDLESLDEKKLTTQEWCQNIADWGDVDDYIDYVHFDIPSQVFHATGEENKESILEKGIEIRSDSRGISNRYLSDSVFTSSEPGEIDSYGSLVFKIDLGKMLADGVISKQDLSQEPDVVRYEKLRALEHLFDLEYDSLGADMEYGMSPHTVVISSSIPPEYLSVFE